MGRDGNDHRGQCDNGPGEARVSTRRGEGSHGSTMPDAVKSGVTGPDDEVAFYGRLDTFSRTGHQIGVS